MNIWSMILEHSLTFIDSHKVNITFPAVESNVGSSKKFALSCDFQQVDVALVNPCINEDLKFIQQIITEQ